MGDNIFDDLIRAGLRVDVSESFPNCPFDSPAPNARATTSPAKSTTLAVASPPPMPSNPEAVDEAKAKVKQQLALLQVKGSPAAKDTNLM
jgi:hypothetical protein